MDVDAVDKTIDSLFWAKVVVRGECWEWTGVTTPKGYGQVRRRKVTEYAHRRSYRENVGEIPEGHQVCHHCDNPPCVRPSHLFVALPAGNTADMVAKGRARGGSNPGEKHPGHKLTDEAVLSIRSEYSSGETTHAALARKHSVAKGLIGMITRGEIWTHLLAGNV